MKRLPVRVRPGAIQDLQDIEEWIAQQSGYPQTAEKYVRRILESCNDLGDFPMKGRSRDDLQPGLRIWPFERTAVIAYRIVNDTVEVTNVFYGGRDYEAILGENDMSPASQRVTEARDGSLKLVGNQLSSAMA